MAGTFDYIIVGAGPAGLQLAYHMQQENVNYLVIEKGETAGTSFKSYPRHGKLISINKVHTGYDDQEINLRWDWNSILCNDESFRFSKFSSSYFPDAKDLVTYLNEYASSFGLNINYNQAVKNITKESGIFTLHIDNSDEEYKCKNLIIASGVAKPYIPNIPGIELTDNYTQVSVNKEEFINKRVLVLGKGNSAFETADHLIDSASLIHVCSPNNVKLAWQTHYVGNLRAVNNNFLDTYQLKSQNAILDADIDKIEFKDGIYRVSLRYQHANGEVEVLEYDRVIVCTGFQLDSSIFGDSCQPERCVDDRFPKLNADWESSNISNLYFAGTLMQGHFYKKTTSGFIHGFRYNVKSLFHILLYKNQNKNLPSSIFNATTQNITDHLVERINRSSALWQQFGYLTDIIDVGNESATYFYELPKDYREQISQQNTFTLSLEFGTKQKDVFNIDRDPNPEKADESFFLHPVIRFYRDSKLIDTLHLVEDLYGEWKHQERHIDFLYRFIDKHNTFNHTVTKAV